MPFAAEMAMSQDAEILSWLTDDKSKLAKQVLTDKRKV